MLQKSKSSAQLTQGCWAQEDELNEGLVLLKIASNCKIILLLSLGVRSGRHNF